ncbi:unnamed protein product, partial [Amoebophrya sp. A25]
YKESHFLHRKPLVINLSFVSIYLEDLKVLPSPCSESNTYLIYNYYLYLPFYALTTW